MDSDRPTSKPRRQYLSPPEVLQAMNDEALYFFRLDYSKVIILALMGGAFVTMGALFSLLLSAEVQTLGVKLLMQGLGFSTGFYMVIVSRAVLFTEANVVMPTSFLISRRRIVYRRAFQFWGLAWLFNMLGAFVVGSVIMYAHSYPESVTSTLDQVIDKKMAYREAGGVASWFKIVLSGMLGNGLIGMAAFLAGMGNTLFGKFVPIFLVVTLFVAANLQHSPANMGYFSLAMANGGGPGWLPAFWWNIIPAGIGNILGATLLVALPMWYALQPSKAELSESN